MYLWGCIFQEGDVTNYYIRCKREDRTLLLPNCRELIERHWMFDTVSNLVTTEIGFYPE